MDVAIRLANTFEELKKGDGRPLDEAWGAHLQTAVHSSEYFVALSAVLSSMESLQREIHQSNWTCN
ncbi:MAG: hypothetical protein GW909_06160 [Sphingomonadales bacterium]|nr:hypothetical protein [Sphingomonadales bacterium]